MVESSLGGSKQEALRRWLRRRNGQQSMVAQQWQQQGDAAREIRDWKRAAEAYEQHLRTRPDDVAIWVQFGHALKESGRLSEAVNAYKRSQELEPHDADRDLHLLHLLERLARETAADLLRVGLEDASSTGSEHPGREPDRGDLDRDGGPLNPDGIGNGSGVSGPMQRAGPCRSEVVGATAEVRDMMLVAERLRR